MKRLVVILAAMCLILFPCTTAAQWPAGYKPAGEFQPDQPGGIRAARVVFTNIDHDKGFVAFSAYEFDSDQTASKAMQPLVDEHEEFMAKTWKGDPRLTSVSSRDLGGDEQLVLAGSFRSGNGSDAVVEDVIAIVRRGNLLWVGTGIRLDKQTPLTDVLDVLERLTDRSPDGEASLSPEGWSGGLFAMLPTIQDLPEGYTQTEILRAIGTPEATPAQ